MDKSAGRDASMTIGAVASLAVFTRATISLLGQPSSAGSAFALQPGDAPVTAANAVTASRATISPSQQLLHAQSTVAPSSSLHGANFLLAGGALAAAGAVRGQGRSRRARVERRARGGAKAQGTEPELKTDLKAPVGHLPLTNCIRDAQVPAEVLNHPAFDKKASNNAVSKSSPVSMLAQKGIQAPPASKGLGSPGAWVGASVPSQRSSPQCRTVAVALSAVELAELVEEKVINEHGLVSPKIPGGAQASAFVIYDEKRKPQYLGFSKDLRNTLRTLLCRRPELTYYFKCIPLMVAEQAAMMEVKNAWIEELGDLPPGLATPREKVLWESPVDGGALSERAYKLTALAKVEKIKKTLTDRGLKETVEFNEDLIAQGKVDVIASALSV